MREMRCITMTITEAEHATAPEGPFTQITANRRARAGTLHLFDVFDRG